MTYATISEIARPVPFAGVANAELAALVLRVSMGILFLAHAGLKIFLSSRPRAPQANSPASAFRVRSPISSSQPNFLAALL